MTDYLKHLIGKTVINADVKTGEMLLSDGSKLIFDKHVDDSLAWIHLTDLHATEAMILSAKEEDDETGDCEGEYRTWVHIVTESGVSMKLAEAEGDASNGYYLHGFALDVKVVPAR